MKKFFELKRKEKLTREQKIAVRAERRHLFFSELKQGGSVLYKNRLQFFMWVSMYLVFALVSLFFTKWTAGTVEDFPLVIADVIPRTISLLVLTLPAFMTKYRKTLFAVGMTVWTVWMLVLSGVVYGVTIFAAIVGAFIVSCFFRIEIMKGNYTTPRPVMTRICVWFYLFAGLTFLIELIHRIDITAPFLNLHTPFESFLKNPDIFALNFIVVLFFGLFIFIVKKRRYAFTVYSCVWIVLAFISFLKYNNVYEPVLLLDAFQLFDALSALTKYYNIFTIILFAILFVALIAALVFLSTKDKGVKVHACAYIAVVVLALATSLSFAGVRGLSYMQSVEKFVRQNYFDYGFPYCFINYAINSRVDMPEGYSDESLQEIFSVVEKEYKAPATGEKVENVIIIQLESYADPYLFTAKYPDLKYEKDPVPFLRKLSSEYSTGRVDVPVFGGQTVKSEFEFLTGISLNTMPKGYNPYVSYLYENSVDSLVRYFKNEGYTATALHNYQGEFFSRNEVYKNLGFDTFIPYECMSGVEKRENAIWANDQKLVDEILGVLDHSEGNDFVMAVTVQLHGNYFPIDESEYTMKISGIPEEEKEFEGQLAYYVSQLQAFDKALENLITALEEREESTYVMMYSDHLPKLFYEYDELSEKEKFTTQYFTWNNINLEKSDADMELSQLSTRLCNELQLSGTFINKFHQVYSNKPQEQYEASQEIVDYYCLITNSNLEEYQNDSYKVGLYPLSISKVVKDKDFEQSRRYVLYGSGITDNTVIVVNGRLYDLTYVDSNTAYFDCGTKILSEGDELTLRILGERNGAVLKESKKMTYNVNE